MKTISLRAKFALWAAALVGLALLVFSGGTFYNLYNEQLEAVDLELEAESQNIAVLLEQEAEARPPDHLVRFQPWLAVAIFDAQGRLERQSKNFPESLARAALTEKGIHTAATTEATWRLVVRPTKTFTLVLAYDLAEVHEIMGDLFLAYGLSVPVVVAIAAFGGWWVAGRALRPIRTLARAVEGVHAERLDHSLPVPPATDEIHRLTVSFNSMLERLANSFSQARRFAADASHELRTPLTIMRAEIERLLREPGISSSQEKRLISLQEEIDRLDHITENLLLLARFDAGSAMPEPTRVDLSELARDACEDAELMGTARGIAVESEIPEQVAVSGNAAHLRRVLLNLLDNATKFNVQGGKVRCTVAMEGGRVVLRVGNTGPGIPEASKSRLFERFFRGDSSRGRTTGHGLGLSLSREIARAHAGELTLSNDITPGWTIFELSLPLHFETTLGRQRRGT